MTTISYDDLYTEFLSITKTDPINIPTEEDKIYDAIHSAIRHYNNRMLSDISYDDETETIIGELNNDALIIMAHFLRLAFLENQLIHFTTLWQPFAQDIGLRNYQAQVKALQYQIERQESKLDQLINRTMTDFM